MTITDQRPPHISDLMQNLLGLIEHAMGQSESVTTRTRLHLAITLFGALGDEFLPLLETRYDIARILTGMARIETSLTEIETGIKEVTTALKQKATQTGAEASTNP